MEQFNLSSSEQKNVPGKNTIIPEIGGGFDKKYEMLKNLKDCDSNSMNEIFTNMSDYQMFIYRMKEQNNLVFPSCFSRINIIDETDQYLQEGYQNISYKILSHSIKQITNASVQIITKVNFRIPSDILTKFVKQIQKSYNIVAYHNFSHAFYLLHLLHHCFKIDKKFSGMFSSDEKSFAFLAALGHDINHPGTNNIFQIKKKSQLAQLANNEQILEKMHVRTFFEILKPYEEEIFCKIANEKRMKQLITRMILATDMSKHSQGFQALKNIKELNHEENRIILLEQVFHACDIGNPCLEYQQYINWASLLMLQFRQQTILEEKMGFQISVFLQDKGLTDFYRKQISFIDNIVYPLWKQLQTKFPKFNIMIDRIETNKKILKEQQNKENE